MSSPHPLDPASAQEYLAGRDILVAAGLLAEPVRFAYYGLEEAAKDEVLAGATGDRRLRAFLVNLDSGESADVVVSLSAPLSSGMFGPFWFCVATFMLAFVVLLAVRVALEEQRALLDQLYLAEED